MASGLLKYSQKAAFRDFKKAYTPLIEEIQHRMPNPCAADYFTLAKVAVYNRNMALKVADKQGKPKAKLFYNPQRFMLTVRGGSIDMDSSIIFYDSESAVWGFFHQDDDNISEHFHAKIAGLTECENF